MACIVPKKGTGVTDPSPNCRFGIDLGGTKIEIIALQHGCHQDILRRRVATPQGDYPATLRAIRDLVLSAEQELGLTGSVGIGIPGTISPATGVIKNANSTCLIGHPLDKDLESLLQRPIRLANDADCFALSEATDGAGQGCPIVFGVILGTGVGAGLVAHGQILRGPNAITGEWGHNPLPHPMDDERPGDRCYCGRSGCIETFLSGPSMARHAALTMSAAKIFQAAEEQNDAAAILAVERYLDRLARSLAHVINILDPHVIILGGGLGQQKCLYQRIPALWGRYIFSDRVDTPLRPPHHGDSSGVRGAAWLWPER